MDKLIKKATGILVGTALAALLNTNAFADDEDCSVPDKPVPVIIESAAETNAAADAAVVEGPCTVETDAAEDPAAETTAENSSESSTAEAEAALQSGEESVQPAVVLPEAENESLTSEQPAAEEAEMTAEESAEDEREKLQPAAVHTEQTQEGTEMLEGSLSQGASRKISDAGGDTKISGTDDVTDGWNETNGTGWRYLVDSDMIVMVDFDGSETSISSEGSDITIAAAGLNRLETISCDGDVNLIGTGILLVDNIELSNSSSFNLLPDSSLYETGGVAVFLKQADGSYLLINGSVEGILDEAYTIPENVTLVVPEGSCLVLQSTGTTTRMVTPEGGGESVTVVDKYTSFPENEEVDYANNEYGGSAPNLNISSGATLVVQEGGLLELKPYMTPYGSAFAPTVMVEGSFNLNGTVYAWGNGQVIISGTGTLTGEANFDSTKLILEGSTDTLNLKDSELVLTKENTLIGNLHVTADSSIFYSFDTEITNTVIDGGETLNVFQKSESTDTDNPTLTFTGKISGDETEPADILFHSGIGVVGADCTVSGTDLSCRSRNGIDYLAVIIDYSGEPYLKGKVPFVGAPSKADTAQPVEDESDIAGYSVPYYYVKVSGLLLHPQLIIGGAVESQIDNVLFEQTLLVNKDGTISDSLANRGALVPVRVFEGTNDDFIINDSILKKTEPDYAKTESYTNGAFVSETHCIILVKNGDGTMELLSSTGQNGIRADDVVCIIWYFSNSVYGNSGGESLTVTNTANTGSGVLGGSGAGSVKGGAATPILTGDAGNGTGESTQAAAVRTAVTTAPMTYTVSRNGGCMHLDVFRGGQPVSFLGLMKIKVHTEYTLTAGCDPEQLYVVFRNAGGSLVAIEAEYDSATGELIFETGYVGDFVVVSFSFAGTEFSPEFYEALAKLDEVRALF